MAIRFRQVGFKLFDQLSNGLNFDENTTKFKDNLAGFVAGNYMAEIDLAVEVSFFENTDTPIEVSLDNDNYLYQDGINWIDEGFTDGDAIEFWVTFNANRVTYSADIVNILGSRVYLQNVTLVSGTAITSGLFVAERNVRLKDKKNNINYSFGLIENEQPFTNQSLLTGASQAYYGTYGDLTPLGQNRDWVTGSISFENLSDTFVYRISEIDGLSIIVGKELKYRVKHKFTINPFYEDGQLSNLTNENGVIPPIYLDGEASLKYAYGVKLRRELSNPNTEIEFNEDSKLGSVAYYNENYNGFNNPFTINSVSYADDVTGQPIEAINPSVTTLITIRVTNNSGVIDDNYNVSFNHFKAAESSEYLNTTDRNLKENFLLDNLIANVSVTGNVTEIGTGIIKEIVTSRISTTELEVRCKVSYGNTEQLRIEQGNYFVISLAIQNNSLAAGSENTVNLLCDVDQYTAQLDIAGLATMPVFNLKDIGLNGAFSSIYAFDEDNIVVDCDLNLTRDVGAYINSLSCKVLAYNSTTFNYFELDSFNIPFNEVIDADGKQRLTYSSGRDYPDSVNSEQRDVNLSTSIFVNADVYNLTFGQKINWKDWVYNRDADTIFYNTSRPNNNLNYKASNYSNIEGYEIRVAVQANIFGFDNLGRSGNTDYLFLSQKIRTSAADSNTDINGTIELFDADTNASLGTTPRIDKDSIFKTTWQGVQITDGITLIHRLEKNGQLGNAIAELGNITDFVGGVLKPLDGDNILRVEQVGNDIVTTCLIDHTKLENGVNYNLSSRIKLGEVTPEEAKLKTSGAVKIKTDATVKYKAI